MSKLWIVLVTLVFLSCDNIGNIKTQALHYSAKQDTVSTVKSSPRITPRSMYRGPGVTLVDYDTSSKHKSKEHYEKLVDILLTEMELPKDTVYIMLIFISEDVKAKIEENNPDWRLGYAWVGLYVGAGTILISKEGDDTFFHELLHYLYNRGEILTGYTPEEAHHIIYIDEQFLITSKSYIDYITLEKQ